MTTKIRMLALELAKGSFQVCAVTADWAVLHNRVMSRTGVATRLADQPACVVAMEACATSHHWGQVSRDKTVCRGLFRRLRAPAADRVVEPGECPIGASSPADGSAAAC